LGGFTKILRRLSATLRRTVTRTIALERAGWALLRWYALYLLHIGGRGDLIPCAGYRLMIRNLSPHSPPLRSPPLLDVFICSRGHLNKHCLRSELNLREDEI
jgi:hypothetical protein